MKSLFEKDGELLQSAHGQCRWSSRCDLINPLTYTVTTEGQRLWLPSTEIPAVSNPITFYRHLFL